MEHEGHGPLMGVRSVQSIGDIANVGLGSAFVVAEPGAAGGGPEIEPATYEIERLCRG